MVQFYRWSSSVSTLESNYEESLLFTTSPQEFVVLILSNLEGWKAESILEPPSGFKLETPGTEIQSPNH